MKQPVRLKNDYNVNKENAKDEVTLGKYIWDGIGDGRFGEKVNVLQRAKMYDMAMKSDITVLRGVHFTDMEDPDKVVDILYQEGKGIGNKKALLVIDNDEKPMTKREHMHLTEEQFNLLKEAGIINEDGTQTKAQKAIFDIDKDHFLSKDFELIFNLEGGKETLKSKLQEVKETGGKNLVKSDGVTKEEIVKDEEEREMNPEKGSDDSKKTKEDQIEKAINKVEGKTIGGKRVIKTIQIESIDQASNIFKNTREESAEDIYLVQLEDNQYRLVSDRGNGNYKELKDYSVNELGKTLNNGYNQAVIQPRDVEMGDNTGYSSLTPDADVITFKYASGNESIGNGNSEQVEVGLDGSVKKFNVLEEHNGIIILDDDTGLEEPYIANFGGKEKLVTTQEKLDEMTGANENPEKAARIQNDMKEGNVAGQTDMIYLKDMVRKRQEIIHELNKGEDADLGKVEKLTNSISELTNSSNRVSIETDDIDDKAKEIEKRQEERAKEEAEKEAEKEAEEAEKENEKKASEEKEEEEAQRTIHDAAKRYY